jgi:hypothetical protein
VYVKRHAALQAVRNALGMGLLGCCPCFEVDSETKLERLIDKFRKTKTKTAADMRVSAPAPARSCFGCSRLACATLALPQVSGSSGLVTVTGHVALVPGVAALQSPVTDKACVYYKVRCPAHATPCRYATFHLSKLPVGCQGHRRKEREALPHEACDKDAQVRVCVRAHARESA